jgi:hypothetical protein
MNVAHAPLCVGQMTAGERGNETTQSGHNKKKEKQQQQQQQQCQRIAKDSNK